jgi:putative protease
MKPEILAPAGNMQSLVAAVRCGADAVYFGAGNFNARRNASNFGGDELKKAIDYCHLHSVKCHITLNTLVSDGEMPELIDTLRRICEAGADALIIQDLGVAKLVREICPDIAMHASTQLSTGTPEGIKLLSELGFSRAVLPRELSKAEIEKIAAVSPVELEAFVHGALCMCVSGQCLLSAMLGSRSGNRGLCAQPCRLPFAAKGGTGTDLSLKDLSLIERINELNNIGVCSFKIEGRMKRPEYVAAAVTACRKALDGCYGENDKNELRALFSRSGFTDGYYEAKLGREMFGKREKDDVTSATGELLRKYEKLYEKENAVYPAEFFFSAHIGEKPTLSAKAEGKSVFVEGGNICEQAISRPLDCESVKAQLSKCGGTVFFADSIECDIGENVSVPLSAINALRREALEKLAAEIIYRKPYKLNEYRITKSKAESTDRRKLCIQFSSVEQIPEEIECDRMFLPLDTDADIIKKYSAGVTVPRGLFCNYDTIAKKLENSPAAFALCNTPDALALAKNAGKQVIGGPFMNIFNSVALGEAERLGVSEQVLSYELTTKQIADISGIKTGCVVYGRTPLMLTRNCPVRNGVDCKECKRRSCLTDRKGIYFPVRCENGFSQLYNSVPTYMLDRPGEIRGTSFDMLVFTTETKEEVCEILTAYRLRSAPKGEYTRGLFTRGVE